MAFGISDLIKNITDSVGNLVSNFQGNSDAIVQYRQGDSDLAAIQSTINQESWAKLIFPYTFSIMNLDNPGAQTGFSDFSLPLAPQTLNQKEEPATSMRPTQGGTTVNRGGIGYKTLTMSGTTGIAPFRGDGGVNLKTGEAILQPKELKYKSGYEVFLHLRNWFRSYYQWSYKNPQESASTRLVFKNYKDGEFLIVELMSFEMDRSANRSFMYDYKLEFKVLAHYEFKSPGAKDGPFSSVDSLLETALNKINVARGIFLRSQGILRQIESTYDSSVLEPLRQTTLGLKAFLGVPLVAADIGSRAILNTVSTAKALQIVAQEAGNFTSLYKTGDSQTKAEIDALIGKRITGSGSRLENLLKSTTSEVKQNGPKGLQKLGGLATKIGVGSFPQTTIDQTSEEQKSASSLPRNFYETTMESLERVKQNAEDFFNLGSDDYDEMFERTSTLSADSTKVLTEDEYELLYAFSEAISGIYLMLSTVDLFKSTFDERIQDMIQRFGGQITLRTSQAVRQIQLPSNTTLERLAQEQLGDSSRWAEIVEVNNLKAPYISNNPRESRDGVLKPGDNILIPTGLVNGFSQAPVGKENRLTKGMSDLEKSLGVDFRIDENFDLIISSSGDFELVAGADNMAQGTILKLSYEPGDVIGAPEIGAGALVGEKFPPLNEIKDRITKSLLQDSRVAKVSDLSLVRESSGLTVSFNLFVKQIDLPIPVKIKV